MVGDLDQELRPVPLWRVLRPDHPATEELGQRLSMAPYQFGDGQLAAATSTPANPNGRAIVVWPLWAKVPVVKVVVQVVAGGGQITARRDPLSSL